MQANLEKKTKTVISTMRREVLTSWNAVDVSECQRLANGDFILPQIEEGKDYLDMDSATWIESIGEALKPFIAERPDGVWQMFPAGTLIASRTKKFAVTTDKFRWRFRRCVKK